MILTSTVACPFGAVCGQAPGTCVFGSTTISLTTTTIVGTHTTTSTIVHDTVTSSPAAYAPLPPPPSSIVDTAIQTLPYSPNISYAPTDVGQPIPLPSSVLNNVPCTSLTATIPVANVTIPPLPTAATTSSLLENTTSTTVLTPISTATLTPAVTPSASPTGGAPQLHAAIGAWKVTAIAGLLVAAFITGV
jgi:hypothetical protein